MDDITDALGGVRRRINEAGGDPDRVEVLAVTKGFGADAVVAARRAGLRSAGENYAQELLAKHAALATGDQPNWHFIGRLQRNKVRHLADVVTVWQSVDSASLVDEIAKRAPGARIFVQVDLTDSPERGGCSWDDAPSLVARARDARLDVAGLMAVGPLAEPEVARPGFRRLAVLAKELDLEQLSMGMTADLEVAVQEGSTMVRVGSALFGTRD